MNIDPEDYPKAIAHLKDKKAIVVLIVDLTDFPGSVWPNILDLIGSDKRVILVGNKVDLLPQDSQGYLKRIQNSMVKTFTAKCQESLDRKPIVLDSIWKKKQVGFPFFVDLEAGIIVLVTCQNLLGKLVQAKFE